MSFHDNNQIVIGDEQFYIVIIEFLLDSIDVPKENYRLKW